MKLLALIAAAWLAYVLPADRIARQIASQRAKAGALRVEVQLAGIGQDWPERAVLEAHPAFGVRVEDAAGGRWLLRGGEVIAGSQIPAPSWIPDLELLVLREAGQLLAAWDRRGIDVLVTELGRCPPGDCFVIGGRAGAAQLWIDKDRFEPVRLSRGPGRPQTYYNEWKSFGELRFPGEIQRSDDFGQVAVLAIQSVTRATQLTAEDFSQSWALAPAANPAAD